MFQILLPSRELKGKLRQEAEDPYRVCVRVQVVCASVCACVLHAYMHMISYSAKVWQGNTLMDGVYAQNFDKQNF